jgi:hypothetical protein
MSPRASAARAEVEVAAKAATPAVARKLRRVTWSFLECPFGFGLWFCFKFHGVREIREHRKVN